LINDFDLLQIPKLIKRLCFPHAPFEQQSNEFISRHIGPDEQDTKQMLKTIGEASLSYLVDKTVPLHQSG
jgi:hypothetical protein